MSDRLDEIRARMRACKCAAHEDARWLLAEVDRLRDGVDAVRALADAAEHGALRWEHPLPVPEWVDRVRRAIGDIP